MTLALSAGSPPARARCFAIADRLYATLDPLVDRNATQALSAVQMRLQHLPTVDAPGNVRQLAALYAVQADAYRLLELDHDAYATAARGLGLLSGAHDPLRLELLSTEALDIYTQAGAREAIGAIEAARAEQPQDSLSGSRCSPTS